MFKVKSVSINGFWQTKRAKSDFRDDVNIIIGRNGTGKTTFMNILHAVLAVDTEALYENPFNSATIVLSDGSRTRTIRADRIEESSNPFPIIEYHISNKTLYAPLTGLDDRSTPLSLRRRAAEDSQKIKQELEQLVSVASLSVYRIGSESDPELRERPGRRHYASSVDMRLLNLAQRLTQYQLELSDQAREISAKLQRDVLTSLLYAENKTYNQTFDIDFDENVERQNLISAYRQLGVSGSETTKKIQDHIAAVSKTLRNLKLIEERRWKQGEPLPDFSALEAFKVTRAVVEKSLDAERKTTEIFRQVELFIQTLKTFIEDKTFTFSSGELTVATEGPIPLAKLSSGEKQLLILFIEALLQRHKPYIFLADEPELSLHISWQRNIVAAIKSINPNAQIIVATHSPEIAGRFREAILDMEDILNVQD